MLIAVRVAARKRRLSRMRTAADGRLVFATEAPFFDEGVHQGGGLAQESTTTVRRNEVQRLLIGGCSSCDSLRSLRSVAIAVSPPSPFGLRWTTFAWPANRSSARGFSGEGW